MRYRRAGDSAALRPRIFDHLNGEPEDLRFSRVAHAMRKSPFWTSISTYEAPPAVAGEIDPTTHKDTE